MRLREARRREGGPAFVPFQLSDEQYASVYRDPDANGYPTLVPGAVRAPKFGYIYVEQRSPGGRRPKLVDGRRAFCARCQPELGAATCGAAPGLAPQTM